eukprot:4052320-Amphidinium_carterae.1
MAMLANEVPTLDPAISWNFRLGCCVKKLYGSQQRAIIPALALIPAETPFKCQDVLHTNP